MDLFFSEKRYPDTDYHDQSQYNYHDQSGSGSGFNFQCFVGFWSVVWFWSGLCWIMESSSKICDKESYTKGLIVRFKNEQ